MQTTKKEEQAVVIFEGTKQRYQNIDGVIWFSIVDAIKALTQVNNAASYWSKIKKSLQSGEKAELEHFWQQLKLKSQDGKYYKTECTTEQGMLRIIQSIPSPKVNKYKQWLAKVGAERLEEERNPDLIAERQINTYMKRGMSRKHAQLRAKSIHTRNYYTDALKEHGIEKNATNVGRRYAEVTNMTTESALGRPAKMAKQYLGLPEKASLRDNLTYEALSLIETSESFTCALMKKKGTYGYDEIKDVAKEIGSVIERTRKDFEKLMGRQLLSNQTANG